MHAKLTVKALLKEKENIFQLKLLTDGKGLNNEVQSSGLNRPGLALAGYIERFANKRIQILGETEISFLRTLDHSTRKDAVDRLLNFKIPCVVVTKDQVPPEPLIELANEKGVSVFSTPINTANFYHSMTTYLDAKFTPYTTMHGTLADVYGVGLLFQGRSGIGKSECVLDLIERGHRLVADDLVHVHRKGDEILMGKGSEELGHNMEIRGIGIIDVLAVFGIRSVRLQKRIEVAVNLEEWSREKSYDRLGLDEKHTTILDVKIPVVTIPLVPGKNITVISEVVAMNYLLKLYGYHPALSFNERLIKLMESKKELDGYLEEDYE